MKAAIFILGLIFALTDIILTHIILGDHHDIDKPLFLSELIKLGDIQHAKDLSIVHAEKFGFEIESYSAYLTVGPHKKIHYHFWYFPSVEKSLDAPYVVFLAGGPGVTSLTGLFGEFGPYYYTEDGRVKWREGNALLTCNILFIDAPVGTGFSFADTSAGVSTKSRDTSDHLLDALDQFFTLFPPNTNQEVYIASEGYASKHAIGVAYLMNTGTEEHRFHLKGILLGSPLIDPVIQLDPSELLYETGVITTTGKKALDGQLQTLRELVGRDQHVEASRLFERITDELAGISPSLFKRESGIFTSGTILRDVLRPEMFSFVPFLEGLTGLKRALHVGAGATFKAVNPNVRTRYVESGDYVKPVTKELEVVLNANVKVLYYTGNMDMLNPHEASAKMANSLRWHCQNQYLHESKRVIWWVDKEAVNSAGYGKSACNFQKILIRNAGHYMASDELKRKLKAVDYFIFDFPY